MQLPVMHRGDGTGRVAFLQRNGLGAGQRTWQNLNERVVCLVIRWYALKNHSYQKIFMVINYTFQENI